VNTTSLANTACEAAEAAGLVLRQAWEGPRRIRRKGAVDLVTDADLAAEAAVLAVIRRAWPSDVIVTEESGVHGGPSTRRWIVDPLDGTTNFAHGNPHVAVSVAVEVDGVPLVGVVHDPFRRETFRGVRGHGAWLGPDPIRVSEVSALDDALVATGFPYDRRARPERYLAFVARVLQVCQGIRRGGSAALDLAWVAAGRLDAFWEWKLEPWDVAAGRVLVREAGGSMTAADGTPHALDGPSTVASNGRLHEEFLRLLAWDGRVP
jgi:myo-inositol-1(or 4)-monophosphatase